MENVTKEGESPVCEKPTKASGTLSSTIHVKFGVKLCRPRHKAKYKITTDSELVPRGKGEKHPC